MGLSAAQITAQYEQAMSAALAKGDMAAYGRLLDQKRQALAKMMGGAKKTTAKKPAAKKTAAKKTAAKKPAAKKTAAKKTAAKKK